jgi:hypothetical protein
VTRRRERESIRLDSPESSAVFAHAVSCSNPSLHPDEARTRARGRREALSGWEFEGARLVVATFDQDLE